jgi:hypothetical protein
MLLELEGVLFSGDSVRMAQCEFRFPDRTSTEGKKSRVAKKMAVDY